MLLGSADAGEVVYRETFPLAADEAAKLTNTGWKAWVYSKGDARVNRNAASYADLVRGRASQPADAAPVAADTTDDAPTGTGMLVNWNGGDFWLSRTLYFTEEFTLADSSSLRCVAWFQNNQGQGGGFRVALKVGPTWYASDENFVGFGGRKLELDGARWRHLNPADLKPDAEATVDALPAGEVSAFGVFGTHTGYAELDTFTLIADEDSDPR